MIGDLGRLDDEGLRTFLDPADHGVRPSLLGMALQHQPDLTGRVAASLPEAARGDFEAGLRAPANDQAVRRAERRVLRRLFWPLLYWCAPDAYLELTAGEDLPGALQDSLCIDGRVVADLGAGAGRFTIAAARRARRVIAVDAVPSLLTQLRQRASAAGLTNVEIRRGSFRRLPLDDDSVDVAVFCSSFHTRGPHGGEGALSEAERVVQPGGTIAVVWPESAEWLLARGFSLLTSVAEPAVRFRNPETAERLCREFYGQKVAAWVRGNGTSEVPCSLLGRPAAGIACIRRIS